VNAGLGAHAHIAGQSRLTCQFDDVHHGGGCGVDEWTGGEYFTHNFIMHMHKVVSGLEIVKPGANDLFEHVPWAGS
jgi:hypothetical protein